MKKFIFLLLFTVPLLAQAQTDETKDSLKRIYAEREYIDSFRASIVYDGKDGRATEVCMVSVKSKGLQILENVGQFDDKKLPPTVIKLTPLFYGMYKWNIQRVTRIKGRETFNKQRIRSITRL